MDLSTLKNKKILIVEDDFTNRELIIEIFEGIDVILDIAITGDEAIKKCTEQDFNLVLMDIQLPGKNGFDATEEIKKIRPELNIIAQTAYAYDTDRTHSLLSGCCDYIAKPFKKEELLRLVLKYI